MSDAVWQHREDVRAGFVHWPYSIQRKARIGEPARPRGVAEAETEPLPV